MAARKLVPKLSSNNDKGFILTRTTEGYADTDCFNAFDRDHNTSVLNTRTEYSPGVWGEGKLHIAFPTTIKKITSVSIVPTDIHKSRYDGLISQTYTLIRISDASTLAGSYSWNIRYQGYYPLDAETSLVLNKTNVKNIRFAADRSCVPEFSEIQIYGYADSYILETDDEYISYSANSKESVILSDMLNNREDLPIGASCFNDMIQNINKSFKIIKVGYVVE